MAAISSKMVPLTSEAGNVLAILREHGGLEGRFQQRPNLPTLRRQLVDVLCQKMRIDLESLDLQKLQATVNQALSDVAAAPPSGPDASLSSASETSQPSSARGRTGTRRPTRQPSRVLEEQPSKGQVRRRE